MQSTRHLIGALIELAARVKHGHGDFEAGFFLGFVHVHRNAPSVVHYGYRIVGIDRQLDRRTVPRQRLVDRVVHDLVHEVMQAANGGRANVHGRPFADGFETLQYLNRIGAVLIVFGRLPVRILFLLHSLLFRLAAANGSRTGRHAPFLPGCRLREAFSCVPRPASCSMVPSIQ